MFGYYAKQKRRLIQRDGEVDMAPSRVCLSPSNCFLLTQCLFLTLASSLFSWSSVQEALALAQTEKGELKEKVEKVQSDAQAEQIKMAAEIEDLSNTKTKLEERLIELIRQVQHGSLVLPLSTFIFLSVFTLFGSCFISL